MMNVECRILNDTALQFIIQHSIFNIRHSLAVTPTSRAIRGFLQTRVEALARSKWLTVLIVSLLFRVYHLPYAYFNPNWPSAGDWGAAWVAALGNGVPGGLVLGALYVKSNRNLVACIVLQSMIGAFPAMTALKFGA